MLATAEKENAERRVTNAFLRPHAMQCTRTAGSHCAGVVVSTRGDVMIPVLESNRPRRNNGVGDHAAGNPDAKGDGQRLCGKLGRSRRPVCETTGQMSTTRTRRLTQHTPVEQPTQAIGAERLKARLQKMEEPARATFLQSASTLKPRLKHTERTP